MEIESIMNQPKQQLPIAPEKLFSTACHLHQKGELRKALLIYEKLHENIQPSPLLFYNIGLAQQELGDYEKAISYYNQAAQLSPHDVDILYNLALCYQKNKNRKMALILYQKAHDCSPDDVDILYNLGCCHQQDHDEDSAMTTYESLMQIDTNHQSTLNNLAYLYQKNGRDNEAVSLYKRLLKLQPNHEGALHMLASLTGSTATSTPKQYIKDVFNHYSSHYESSLVDELGYDVPDKLRKLYDSHFQENRPPVKAIDLGCGTGLSGLSFHDICDNLTGIDLSENMVEEAEKKQIYDQLVIKDILGFLKKKNNCYDLIIAADVLTYMGDLSDIFKLAYTSGSDGCVFCFSTEKTNTKGFRLGKTGRFQHSINYLHLTAQQTGWQTLLQVETDLRMEKGVWIPGNLTFLGKPKVSAI